MLEFHLSTIIFTIINLLVLYAVLRKLLFGKVNAVLQQRAALVQQEMDAARADNRQAQELKEQYEEKLQDAHQEAEKILSDAQIRAQRVYEGKVAEAEREVQRLRGEAQVQIATERETMLRGARQEVASLALLAAAKVAGRSMDSGGDRAFVEEFLTEVGEQA